MTPERNCSMPGVLKRRLRYARRFSSVDSTLTVLKRFSQVPLDSSAARMPLPLATIAAAVLESSALSMRVGKKWLQEGAGEHYGKGAKILTNYSRTMRGPMKPDQRNLAIIAHVDHGKTT